MKDPDNQSRQEPFTADESSTELQTDRLGSWKVIASYLRRSVRTVRRWEEKEGLPIHRHQHEKGSTVFAYRSEIDSWRERRRVSQERPKRTQPTSTQTPAPAPAPKPRTWLQPVAWGTAAIALCFTIVTLGPSRSIPGLESGDGTARAWVLVADVEATPSQAELAGHLQRELEAMVVNAKGLDLVPDSREHDTLRLMRLDPGTPVTENLAREVGLRDSQIARVLVGSVSTRAESTFLAVELIDPVAGMTVRSLSSGLEGGDPGRAARNLAGRARELFHATTRSEPGTAALPRVTTASLDALRLYAHGERQLREGHAAAATTLLRRAQTEDPRFATAMALADLASVKAAPGRPSEPVTIATDGISLQERYLVEAIEHQLRDRPGQAAASYRALASLEPTSYWAARGLLETCRELQPGDACAPELVQLADLSPRDSRAAYAAARSLQVAGSSEAEAYARRASTLMAHSSPQAVDPETLSEAMLRLFTAQRHWLDKDVQAASREIDSQAEAQRAAEELPDPIHDELGRMALTLGRIDEAVHWFRALDDPLTRHEMQALALLDSGKENLRGHLVREVDYRRPLTAGLLAMAGLGDRARRLVDRLEPISSAGEIKVARGILSFFAGRLDESIEQLQLGLPLLGVDSSGLYFMGTDLLAAAHARRGELTTALAILEPTAGRRARSAAAGTGMFWIKCQSHLAGFYRQAGREADAAEVERELLHLLRSASPDHALVRELRTRLEATRTG